MRVPGDRLFSLVQRLSVEELHWSEVMSRFTVVNPGGAGADDGEGDNSNTDKPAANTSVTTAAATVVASSPRGAFSRPAQPIIPHTTTK